MQNGSFQGHPLMRLTLGLTLVFIAFMVVTNFALYFAKMNLSPASVVSYYRGSEEAFRLPRTYLSMLEVTHSHLSLMAVVLLMLTHLFIFTAFSGSVKVVVISVTFGSALLNEGAAWLVRFVSPHFALLKVAGFLGLQGSLIFLLLSLGILLLQAQRKARALQKIDRLEKVSENFIKKEEHLP